MLRPLFKKSSDVVNIIKDRLEKRLNLSCQLSAAGNNSQMIRRRKAGIRSQPINANTRTFAKEAADRV